MTEIHEKACPWQVRGKEYVIDFCNRADAIDYTNKYGGTVEYIPYYRVPQRWKLTIANFVRRILDV